MHRLVAVALTFITIAACHRDVSAPPSRATVAGSAHRPGAARVAAAPRPAGATFTPMEGEVAVRLPPGLTYCPMPEGAEGVWREQTFYLVAPSECGSHGEVVGAGEGPLPSISVRAEANLNAFEAQGGVGEARTAAEFVRQGCVHPAAIPGLRLLGRPPAGCRVERNGTVQITAATLYYAQRPEAPGVVPDQVLTVTLLTTPARFATDSRILAAVADGAYRCAEIGGRSGLPPCPVRGPGSGGTLRAGFAHLTVMS